jgi:hypothetical protein
MLPQPTVNTPFIALFTHIDDHGTLMRYRVMLRQLTQRKGMHVVKECMQTGTGELDVVAETHGRKQGRQTGRACKVEAIF